MYTTTDFISTQWYTGSQSEQVKSESWLVVDIESDTWLVIDSLAIIKPHKISSFEDCDSIQTLCEVEGGQVQHPIFLDVVDDEKRVARSFEEAGKKIVFKPGRTSTIVQSY